MANEIDINKLRELHAATTQGEWTDGDSIVWLDNTDDDDFVSDCSLGYFSEERQAANATFIAAAHNAMPALLDELERLRAFKIDGMTIDDLNRLRQTMVDATAARSDFEKALDASEERVAELLRENAELKAKLDTEKRAALNIAIAALNTGCVKPDSKGTVEAVNDIAAEIERL